MSLPAVTSRRCMCDDDPLFAKDRTTTTTTGSDQDALVRCNGRQFRISRRLLISRIPFFEHLRKSSPNDADPAVYEWNECSPEVLQVILQFVETNKLPDLPEDGEFFLALLSVTHSLQVWSLFDPCCNQCTRFINQTNYQIFWRLAKSLSAPNLLDHVLEFIAENFVQVKQEIVNRIGSEELHALLSNPRLKATSSDLVLEFIFEWVERNVPERHAHLTVLIGAVDDDSLSRIYLESISLHEALARVSSCRYIDAVLETVTRERLKLFMVSRTAFQFYSVDENEWSPPTSFSGFQEEQVRATAYVWNHLYVFTGTDFIPFDIKSLFKYSIVDNTVEKLKTIDIEGQFYLTVMNGIIFLLCSKTCSGSRSDCLYVNTLYYYDPNRNEFDVLKEELSVGIVYYLVSVPSGGLYVYDEPEESLSNALIRYDVHDRHKRMIPYPEPSLHNHKDLPTSCLGDFYLLRHGEEIDSFSWKRNDPQPLEQMEAMRALGFLTVTTSGNRCTCQVLSKKKTFHRYVEERHEWETSASLEGPQQIRYVWRGPASHHLRVPLIYVIDTDWVLHSYEPKAMQWSSLGQVPNRERFSRSLPFWTMGC